MKNVLGGTAPPPVGSGSCSYFGSCATWPTSHYDPDNAVSATIQQAIADEWCESHDCCTNVDCPGAVG